ncbi:MAG TPA: hypothetical protein VGQ25_03405 [Gemmatimonadales bacterium]|jgi:hypothetical protein|nr:hypothetical protein [Gemmatimonadales bacterium]
MPPMSQARLAAVILLGLALAAACGENGPGGSPRVVIDPVLDSLFVGDTRAPGAFGVTYYDADGHTQPTGPVRWASSDTAAVRVDSVTGEVVARGHGPALLSARANGTTGRALLVVSRPLDVALLLDTIYLMEGDTFTVPVSVRVRGGGPATVWFRTPANAVHAVDSATGRDSAFAPGPARPFFVFAATATDTVADTGATEVVQLTDTMGGKAFFTVLGSAIRRARAGARAVNYRRAGDTATFRLSAPITIQNTTVENVVITLRDSVGAAGTFGIDSLSPQEAANTVFICRPKRSWALWSTSIAVPPLRALSRPGGTITITKIIALPHGRAIGGRFLFTGQRSDMYDEPLGALPIRGTFVAPLITDVRRTCG